MIGAQQFLRPTRTSARLMTVAQVREVVPCFDRALRRLCQQTRVTGEDAPPVRAVCPSRESFDRAQHPRENGDVALCVTPDLVERSRQQPLIRRPQRDDAQFAAVGTIPRLDALSRQHRQHRREIIDAGGGGGRVVDAGRERLERDVDELADAERGILIDRAVVADGVNLVQVFGFTRRRVASPERARRAASL